MVKGLRKLSWLLDLAADSAVGEFRETWSSGSGTLQDI